MLSAKLKTLLAVSEQQNFTKAAELLSLTQPAVSHHINQLEEEFGVTLFVRGKGGLKLTEEGEIVVHYAEEWQLYITVSRQIYRMLKSTLLNCGSVLLTLLKAI